MIGCESKVKISVGRMTAGEEGIITKIRGAAALHRYLFGLGIIAGVAIARVRSHAPAVIGNPVPFRIRNKIVYLTEEISRCIQVTVCGRENAGENPDTGRRNIPERVLYPPDPRRSAVNPASL